MRDVEAEWAELLDKHRILEQSSLGQLVLALMEADEREARDLRNLRDALADLMRAVEATNERIDALRAAV